MWHAPHHAPAVTSVSSLLVEMARLETLVQEYKTENSTLKAEIETMMDEHALVVMKMKEEIARFKAEHNHQRNTTTTTTKNEDQQLTNTMRSYLAGAKPDSSPDIVALMESAHVLKSADAFEPVGAFVTLPYNILCMAMFKRAEFCLVGSSDRVTRMFATKNATLIAATDTRAAPPIQIATSRDHIAVGRLDGVVDIFLVETTPTHIALVFTSSYSHQVSKSVLSVCSAFVDDDVGSSNKIFASTARDCRVIFWLDDDNDGQRKVMIELKQNAETSCFLDIVNSTGGNKERWFVAALQNEIVVFDTSLQAIDVMEIHGTGPNNNKNNQKVGEGGGSGGLITAICEVRGVPSLLVVANSCGTVCLFNVMSKSCIKEFVYPKTVDELSRACVRADPCGEGWIAFTDGTSMVMVWHVTHVNHTFPFVMKAGHSASVRSLAWQSDGKCLWSCGFDKMVRRWSVA